MYEMRNMLCWLFKMTSGKGWHTHSLAWNIRIIPKYAYILSILVRMHKHMMLKMFAFMENSGNWNWENNQIIDDNRIDLNELFMLIFFCQVSIEPNSNSMNSAGQNWRNTSVLSRYNGFIELTHLNSFCFSTMLFIIIIITVGYTIDDSYHSSFTQSDWIDSLHNHGQQCMLGCKIKDIWNE